MPQISPEGGDEFETQMVSAETIPRPNNNRRAPRKIGFEAAITIR